MGTARRWTETEDNILIKMLQEYPSNKRKAFREAAERLSRSEEACSWRWYCILSNPESKNYKGVSFMVISRKSKLDNRTVSTDKIKAAPEKVEPTIFTRILNLFRWNKKK